jgi:acyl carrier protein
MTDRNLTKELLSHGLVDSIQLIDIVDAVCRHNDISLSDEAAIIGPSLDVIRELLEAKYIYAGDAITDAAGVYTVHPWKLAPSDAVSRIEKDWIRLERQPTLGDIVWFELTDAGRKAAEKVDRADST